MLVRHDRKAQVCGFIIRTNGFGDCFPASYEALGAYDGDELLGGFLYTNYQHIADGLYSYNLHMAGQNGWLSRQSLRQFFMFPFVIKKCCRVIGNIKANNTKARDIVERLGFRLDGIIRSGIRDKYDICNYTMLRNECKWIG